MPLNQVAMTNLADHRGCVYEKPEFEVRIVNDADHFFAADLARPIEPTDLIPL